jgi:gamma-glutamylcyclotransferase
MEFWYFAYGSNLLSGQMIERTGAIGHGEHPPRIARLENHRLVFQQLEEGGPAFANIRYPGDGVLGVVYRCSQAELERLDHYEGGYERQPISVTDQHGEVLAAVAYFVLPSATVSFARPQEEYLAKIITGARQHGLPESYIDEIIAIAGGEIL